MKTKTNRANAQKDSDMESLTEATKQPTSTILENAMSATPLLAVESLTELTCEINRERESRAALIDEHAKELAVRDRVIAKLVERFENARKGLNPSLIALAETVLRVRGNYANAGGESASVVSDAITDLADNFGGKLCKEEFGVKNYDRWIGQRCDCSYGYGPRHGYVVFAVGLSHDLRNRIEEGCIPTDEEAEAAIYYLANLTEIQASRASAASA